MDTALVLVVLVLLGGDRGTGVPVHGATSRESTNIAAAVLPCEYSTDVPKNNATGGRTPATGSQNGTVISATAAPSAVPSGGDLSAAVTEGPAGGLPPPPAAAAAAAAAAGDANPVSAADDEKVESGEVPATAAAPATAARRPPAADEDDMAPQPHTPYLIELLRRLLSTDLPAPGAPDHQASHDAQNSADEEPGQLDTAAANTSKILTHFKRNWGTISALVGNDVSQPAAVGAALQRLFGSRGTQSEAAEGGRVGTLRPRAPGRRGSSATPQRLSRTLEGLRKLTKPRSSLRQSEVDGEQSLSGRTSPEEDSTATRSSPVRPGSDGSVGSSPEHGRQTAATADGPAQLRKEHRSRLQSAWSRRLAALRRPPHGLSPPGAAGGRPQGSLLTNSTLGRLLTRQRGAGTARNISSGRGTGHAPHRLRGRLGDRVTEQTDDENTDGGADGLLGRVVGVFSDGVANRVRDGAAGQRAHSAGIDVLGQIANETSRSVNRARDEALIPWSSAASSLAMHLLTPRRLGDTITAAVSAAVAAEGRRLTDRLTAQLHRVGHRLDRRLERLPRLLAPAERMVMGALAEPARPPPAAVRPRSELERLQRQLRYSESAERASAAELARLRRRLGDVRLARRAHWSVTAAERNGDLMAHLWTLQP